MAEKMWGGRFDKKTDSLVEKFTKSIHYDRKLVEYDLLGSMAHVQVLRKAGYVTNFEASKMIKGLKAILSAVRDGSFQADTECEDIHTDIQNKLKTRIGDAALKLHTARSRNDQVVLATKLYCKEEITALNGDIAALVRALKDFSKKNDIVIPGFTHMQHAQPVNLKDHIGAYIQMLSRDSQRLSDIAKNLKLTMGAGALAGTPIDKGKYAMKKLGIQPTENPIDSVSDRDFVLDVMYAAAIIGMHLSRLAEDLIIWSTKEFDLVEIDDSFCTGSSLMPHKRNPDALELIRGSAGRLCGNLIGVLTVMKGLPLSYNRDMQLDKEPLFASVETVSDELKILKGIVSTLKLNKAKIEEHLEDESLYATDILYYLVNKGVPFKNAHAIVGRLIKYSVASGIAIASMTNKELRRFSEKLVREDIIKLFDPQVSVKSKKSVLRRRG